MRSVTQLGNLGLSAREVDDATWQVQVHTAGSIWGHQGSL